MGLPYLYFSKGEETKEITSYRIVVKSYIIHTFVLLFFSTNQNV